MKNPIRGLIATKRMWARGSLGSMAQFVCKLLINLIVKWLLGPFVAVVSVCMYSVCRDAAKSRVK